MHLKDDELVTSLSTSLGEELLAAAYARVSTALSVARLLTPIGNYLIARPAARAAAHKITEETSVPMDAAVIIGIRHRPPPVEGRPHAQPGGRPPR